MLLAKGVQHLGWLLGQTNDARQHLNTPRSELRLTEGQHGLRTAHDRLCQTANR